MWKEQYGTEIIEQHLYDQARMIRKNEWITHLELENIERKVLQREKGIEVRNNDNTGEKFYQDEENTHKNKATQVDKENARQWDKTMIQNILDLMKSNNRMELRRFSKIDRCVIPEWSRKINCTLNHIRTENIIDTG